MNSLAPKRLIEKNINFHQKKQWIIVLLVLFLPGFILFSSFSVNSKSMQDSSVKVTLKMRNLKPVKSVVFVAVFDSEDSFLSDNRFRGFKIDNPGKTEISKTVNIPKGKYGIAVFQDLNGNGELDQNFIGIPKEPTAMSNGATGTFGPPTWKDSVIELAKPTTLTFNFND